MPVSTGATTPRLLGSAMKCLALLDALASEAGPAGVSELARRTNTARGTTYQRLQTLVAAGWVEAVGEGKYRLTLRALIVGNAVLEQADLGSRILPTLTALAARTGETSSLAVLDHDSAMIIQRVASDRALKADIKTGTRMPLDTSASGRVLDRLLRGGRRRGGAPLRRDDAVARDRRGGAASGVRVAARRVPARHVVDRGADPLDEARRDRARDHRAIVAL